MKNLLSIFVLLFAIVANAAGIGLTEAQLFEKYGNNPNVQYKVSFNSEGTRYIEVIGGEWGGNMPKSTTTTSYYFFEKGSSTVTKEKMYLHYNNSTVLSKSYASIYAAFIVEWFATYDGGVNKVTDAWTNEGSRHVRFKRSEDIVQVDLKKETDGTYRAILWIYIENIQSEDNPF